MSLLVLEDALADVTLTFKGRPISTKLSEAAFIHPQNSKSKASSVLWDITAARFGRFRKSQFFDRLDFVYCRIYIAYRQVAWSGYSLGSGLLTELYCNNNQIGDD